VGSRVTCASRRPRCRSCCPGGLDLRGPQATVPLLLSWRPGSARPIRCPGVSGSCRWRVGRRLRSPPTAAVAPSRWPAGAARAAARARRGRQGVIVGPRAGNSWLAHVAGEDNNTCGHTYANKGEFLNSLLSLFVLVLLTDDARASTASALVGVNNDSPVETHSTCRAVLSVRPHRGSRSCLLRLTRAGLASEHLVVVAVYLVSCAAH
jgi:hypothetical protein